jgi:hypothetical protein
VFLLLIQNEENTVKKTLALLAMLAAFVLPASAQDSTIETLRYGTLAEVKRQLPVLPAVLDDDLGLTPLMCAAASNKADVVRELLKAGARVDAKNRYGVTPLMYAAYWSEDVEVIRQIIGAGAGVNDVDAEGGSPVAYALAGFSDGSERLRRDKPAVVSAGGVRGDHDDEYLNPRDPWITPAPGYYDPDDGSLEAGPVVVELKQAGGVESVTEDWAPQAVFSRPRPSTSTGGIRY